MRALTFQLQCRSRLLLRSPRTDILSRVFIRAKTVDSVASKNIPPGRTAASQSTPRPPKNEFMRTPPVQNAPQPATPQARLTHVVIYNAGTGKIAFIGMLRATTILLFVVSCGVVAPAFYASEEAPWYIAPAIVAGGTIPMLFVAWTATPFVNQVYLALPSFAQLSKKAMRAYLNNVPRTANVSIETMKFNFYPHYTRASISELVTAKAKTRPVSFRTTKSVFFAPEKSRPAKSTSRFFPGAWQQVFKHIKENSSKRV